VQASTRPPKPPPDLTDFTGSEKKTEMTVLQLIFLITAAVTLASAIMVVVGPNLVHAALWLILALAGVTVLFVLLDAGFLAVVQVAVYIGAIAILIIFAVMLTRHVTTDAGPQVTRSWWLAGLASLVLFGGLLAMLSQIPSLTGVAQPLPGNPENTVADLGRSLVSLDQYVLPFETASVLLLAALIGAIVIALPPKPARKDEGES
jgi:NADH-quinone oxidoreductase subunit J